MFPYKMIAETGAKNKTAKRWAVLQKGVPPELRAFAPCDRTVLLFSGYQYCSARRAVRAREIQRRGAQKANAFRHL